MNDARLFGVLVTYRRPETLTTMLQCLSEQTLQLVHLVVIDNAASPEVAAIVEDHDRGQQQVTYVGAAENLGPAGGIALGMERILARADADDWMVVLDDDNPPGWPTVLAELFAFGQSMRREDPRTAAIGLVGARFDCTRGRLIRPHDEELSGPVDIDYIGGNHLPMYRCEAVRKVGTFSAPLFFGFDDLEYGLRLRKAGYNLYASGELWRRQRRAWGHTHRVVRPSAGLSAPSWRRYYSLRNTIHILRKFGGTPAAVRVTAVQGFLKPLANLASSPGHAMRHLRLNMAACRDGWMGRLGRTLEPQVPLVQKAPERR
jgi:glycosyltransferase involved in cell wall biosynthesis